MVIALKQSWKQAPNSGSICNSLEPNDEILPGVRWGRPELIFSPAFWSYRGELAKVEGLYQNHKLGRSLVEEVAACLLGGFGMKAEVGLAAFHRLVDRGLLHEKVTAEELETALVEPLLVNSKKVRYRYPRQKSNYLADAMRKLGSEDPPNDPLEFRDWLLSISGIGMKTASWITRNHLDADSVAILDVHIIRAGLLINLFDAKHSVTRDYLYMEERLRILAESMDLGLAFLDAMLWYEMREFSSLALLCLKSD